MESKKNSQKKNGFAVLVLDILFVAAGVVVLLISLLRNKDIVASVYSAFFK